MKSALEGLKVVDLSTNIAGPNCTGHFADFGADVLKIERPIIGDDSRTYAPIIDGIGVAFWYLNRGKRSVTLDLTDPRGVEIFKKIAKDTDVLVESNRVGIMDQLGVGYNVLKEINPRLIFCSITAYGQTGPNAHKPGYDMIAQAESSLIDYNGDPDRPGTAFSFAIGDYIAGLYAVIGISHALQAREKTGRGQHVDISVVDGLMTLTPAFDVYSITKRMLTRGGNHQRQSCPYGIFNGKNGQSLAIATTNNKTWNFVCDAMGADGDALRNQPGFENNATRSDNRERVIAGIEAWLQKFDNIDDAAKLLEERGAPCGKVATPVDVLNNPVYRERGALVEISTPSDVTSVKSYITRGPAPHLSETPGFTKRAPGRNEHTAEVFAAYGYDKAYTEMLLAEWEIPKKKEK